MPKAALHKSYKDLQAYLLMDKRDTNIFLFKFAGFENTSSQQLWVSSLYQLRCSLSYEMLIQLKPTNSNHFRDQISQTLLQDSFNDLVH